MKAFPNGVFTDEKGKIIGGHMGMDLRDYFAAKAMQAAMLKERLNHMSHKELCEGAYITADAMMKAREIKGE